MTHFCLKIVKFDNDFIHMLGSFANPNMWKIQVISSIIGHGVIFGS